MIGLLMPFFLYWCFAKSMDDWNWRFYVAAPVFVIMESSLRWVLASAYSGEWQMLNLWTVAIHLGMALPLFYLLERYSDSDDLLSWPLLFGVGLLMVFSWQTVLA